MKVTKPGVYRFTKDWQRFTGEKSKTIPRGVVIKVTKVGETYLFATLFTTSLPSELPVTLIRELKDGEV